MAGAAGPVARLPGRRIRLTPPSPSPPANRTPCGGSTHRSTTSWLVRSSALRRDMQTRSPPPVRPRLWWTTAIRTAFLPPVAPAKGPAPAAPFSTPAPRPGRRRCRAKERGGTAARKKGRRARPGVADAAVPLNCARPPSRLRTARPRRVAPARACILRPCADRNMGASAGGRLARARARARCPPSGYSPPAVAFNQNRAQAALPDESSATQTTCVKPHDTNESGGGRQRTRTSAPSTRSDAGGAS